jgi:ATP-binding cassette subfamily F protein 3
MIQLAKKQGGGRKQAKKLSSARKRLEREVKSSEIDQYTKQEMKNLAISGSVHSRKLILELDDIAFGYAGGENLLEHLSLEVYGSETLWLYGPNGTGKSTLLKIITGELEPDSGTVRWGKDVRWSYFAQDQTNMATETTVQEYFHDQTDVVWEKSYGALQRFMFDKSLRNRRVMDLSPGQKARLTFAIFAQKELECLILDEPTNHLDIETKESIEVALREYQGVIILVSHDRYFAEQMKPDRVLTIQNKGLKAEPGFLLE